MPLVAPGAEALPPPAAANDCPSNHPQQSVSRRLWWGTGPAVTAARCFTMTAAPTFPRSWRPSRRSIFRSQVFLPRNGGLSRPQVRPAEKADPRHPAAPASPPTPTSSHARTSAMGRLHHYHRRDSDRTFVPGRYRGRNRGTVGVQTVCEPALFLLRQARAGKVAKRSETFIAIPIASGHSHGTILAPWPVYGVPPISHGVPPISQARAGRGEAIRIFEISDRQLPPGLDPGADCGEAPDGLQRGSRPLDILVECRGCDRPRREVRTRREDRFDHDEHSSGAGPNP